MIAVLHVAFAGVGGGEEVDYNARGGGLAKETMAYIVYMDMAWRALISRLN